MKLQSRVGTILLGLVLAITGIATFAPPAAAAGGGTASVSGNTITFTGTDEVDKVGVGGNYPGCQGATYCVFFFATDGTLTAGSGCVADAPNQVSCRTSGPAEVVMQYGAGNDYYDQNQGYPGLGAIANITVDGGDGNDTLYGGGPPETLIGGAGNDAIYPDLGPNVSNVGPDTVLGGAGTDTVYYNGSAGAASGARISLNDLADDGTSNPRDIDNIGNDVEVIYGTDGDDVVSGDASGTEFFALAGDDTIRAANGASDQITCGPGTDTVTADSTDRILDSCESVTIPGSGTQLAAEIQVTKTRLNANKRRKKATLALQCTGGLPCTGTVVVRTTTGKSRRIAGDKKLALGTFTLAANTKQTVNLKLRRPARKILKQTRRAGVRARLTLTNERVTTFTILKLTR